MKPDNNQVTAKIILLGDKQSGKSSLLSIFGKGVRSAGNKLWTYKRVSGRASKNHGKEVQLKTTGNKYLLTDPADRQLMTGKILTHLTDSDIAVFLMTPLKGMSKRLRFQSFQVSFSRVPYVFVLVNMLDKVKFSEKVFKKCQSDFLKFSRKLDLNNISFVPVSAKNGDNIFSRTEKTRWYKGAAFFQLLENVNISSGNNMIDFRLPVNKTGLASSRYSTLEGNVVSGTVRRGEKVFILPSGKVAQIKSLQLGGRGITEATVPQSVRIVLRNKQDLNKGDMLVRKKNIPNYEREFEAMIYWTAETGMKKDTGYLLQHTTNSVKAFVSRIYHIIDINTLHRKKPRNLKANETARVEIKVKDPIFFDSFKENRETGRFKLLDPESKAVLAVGTIRGVLKTPEKIISKQVVKGARSSNVSWEKFQVTSKHRLLRNKHKPAVLWFTGFSGSGKSTIAKALEAKLFGEGYQTVILDGDNVRHGLCGDLGFSDEDRTENIRRVSEAAKLFYDLGIITICTFISPFKKDRAYARKIIPAGSFYEVFIKCDIKTCIQRDPKGLYKKALAGKIPEFTGISSHYDVPEKPEIIVDTGKVLLDEIVTGLSKKIIQAVGF